MPNNIFAEIKPLTAFLSFVNADGLTVKNLTQATSRSQRWDTILVANTDTIAHVVRVYAHKSTTMTLIGSVNVPAGAGTAGVAAVELIAALFPTGSQGAAIEQSDYLQMSVEVAVVVAFTVWVFAFGAEL
jgi:hypothetical protein